MRRSITALLFFLALCAIITIKPALADMFTMEGTRKEQSIPVTAVIITVLTEPGERIFEVGGEMAFGKESNPVTIMPGFALCLVGLAEMWVGSVVAVVVGVPIDGITYPFRDTD